MPNLISKQARGFAFSSSIIGLMYGNGLWARIKAAVSLAKISLSK
jgi:hypothetical protein